jgi:hypothetical protein
VLYGTHQADIDQVTGHFSHQHATTNLISSWSSSGSSSGEMHSMLVCMTGTK